MQIASLSVRARLSLWYLAVMSTGLLLFGVLSCGALRFALLRAKRATLTRREERLIQFLKDNKARHHPPPLSEQLQNYAVITHEGNLFEIRNSDGSLLFPRSPTSSKWISSMPENCIEPVFRREIADGEPVMVRCHLILLNGRLERAYFGGSLEEPLEMLRTYRDTLLLLLPGLLGLAALSGHLLSRHALRSVDQMTRAAVEIGIGNLSARLPVPPARDEIRELALAWNQLLDRLEDAVTRLTRFSADVSHDLRTSITVMLGTAQLLLQHRHWDEECHEDLKRIVTECLTASALLDALLSIARKDAFIHEVEFRSIDLNELVIAGCRRIEDLAATSGIMLDWQLPAQAVYVEGDELLLHRLLGILLDNAVKFTPRHGKIQVEVSVDGLAVTMTVRDTGIGMSAEVQQRIFDRFYQADMRERRSQPGSGLGLSIARWVAEAHHLELSVESAPMMGSAFHVRFPISVSAQVIAASEQFA